MTTSVEEIAVEQMSVEARLELLERVWNSLLQPGQLPPIPEWHREELRRRIERANANPEASVPLEEFREHLARQTETTPVQIGERELVFSATFLIADREVARFEVPVGDQRFPVRLQFIPSENDPVARWRYEEGVLHLRILGWSSSVATSLAVPMQFGEVGGKTFGFTLVHQKVLPSNNLATVQFLTGGTYE